ncbi:TonB-dependent receptor [Novosphingobium sp. JCM 18896]|uniref:TonB-dependent receptor n=1 Tax=Novosphingobium sp. JCM 18896 TaxID=2989731 RepID=UPI0022233AD6|nr:TonB-dependent receptor [Novosphingobium sp. JCM 18896]
MKRTRNFALAATAMAVVMTTPVFAQEAAETNAGDIIVTARRMDERLQDVPISITVYNPEQLAARNIVNSTDLATYTPSLTVNGRYGPDKSSFAIRGFSQDLNTAPSVAVYFAEATAPRLSSNITSGNGAGVGQMMDLQNVQVLKGPQGTLFGRNTTGGAILLVPQKPTDRFEGNVEGTIGNYDQWRIQGVLNVPLGDSIRFRAAVDRNTRDGYIRNRSGVGPSTFNDIDYWAARASLVIDVTPDLENYAIFSWAKSDTNGYMGKYAYCNRGTVAGSDGNIGTALTSRAANCTELDRQTAARYGYYDVANNNRNSFVKNETWQAINTTTWRASDEITVKNIFSYGKAKESYSFNLSGDAFLLPALGDTTVPRSFVITNPGPDGGQGDQWTLSEELQLQGHTAGDKLVWQVGGYLEHSEPNKQQTQYTAILSNCVNQADVWAFNCSALGNISIAHNNYFYKNYGLYAQATYKLTEQFAITGGIRNTWDRVRVEADNIQVIRNATTGALTYRCARAAQPAGGATAAVLTNGACGIGRSFETRSSKPTWLINLDFKPDPDTLIYAKYARGYRGGSVNEANLQFEAWQPEYVDSYELGAKASFNSGDVRGNLNFAAFLNKFKDQQVSVFIPQCLPLTNANGVPNVGGRATCTAPAPTGINGIQNVGRSELKGVEVDGSLMIGDAWRFDLGYAYLDAKVIQGGGTVTNCNSAAFNCDQASGFAKGTILPFAPKNRVTLTATYSLSVPEEVGKVSFGATFTHTDKQFSNHGNDKAFAQGAIPYNASIAPATDLLNLNFNWNSIAGSGVDLAVFATNVTGQKYWVASSNGLASSGAEWLLLGAPRMYGMRVKINFGS